MSMDSVSNVSRIFRVSPLLQNAIQGLDVPGAAFLVPPGDKTCRKRGKAEPCCRAEGRRSPWQSGQTVAHWHRARVALAPWLPATLHPQHHMSGCASRFLSMEIKVLRSQGAQEG